MINLADQLAARLAEFNRTAPAERRLAFEAQIEALRASDAERRVLATGAMVPDLTLPDALGRPRRLHDLLPAVIIFYRG
ncbi:MAG: AhpC/TSA family protein, partial [Acetobacteraceae bacterium]|nr:AhpC/TSA family protein [Acetobacteraceae bacterium]